MSQLYRIGVIGSKKAGGRRYVSGTAEAIELSGRAEALQQWAQQIEQLNERWLKLAEQFELELGHVLTPGSSVELRFTSLTKGNIKVQAAVRSGPRAR